MQPGGMRAMLIFSQGGFFGYRGYYFYAYRTGPPRVR
jgi:hypothetical protein